jgi:hypothetical protein
MAELALSQHQFELAEQSLLIARRGIREGDFKAKAGSLGTVRGGAMALSCHLVGLIFSRAKIAYRAD